MQTALLWFDDSEIAFIDKLKRAALYHEEKYGARPLYCFAHPSILKGKVAVLDGISVELTNNMMPHHLWIGRNDGDEPYAADQSQR